MLRNYLRIAFRSLLKYKIYSTISILGLAVGMAACLLIALFILNEGSFDAWHENKDRVYRLDEIQSWSGITPQQVALTMYPMGPAMLEDFPEIESFVRIRSGPNVIRVGDNQFLLRTLHADSAFFKIFSFPIDKGDRESVLAEPSQVVLTQTMAERLFGNTDAVGKNVVIDENNYLVSGIMPDPPRNSHIQFDALISMITIDSERRRNSWGSNSFNTYLLLREGTNSDQLQAKFDDFLVRYMGEESLNSYELFLQPLSDIHLGSAQITHDYNNFQKFDRNYLTVFAVLGGFVLIIACVNFMNLATARSFSRAREIGIRKTIGALRIQLLKQFLGESVLSSVLGLLLALLLAALLLPVLNTISGRTLELDLISQPLFAAGLILSAIIVGIFAGVYPALFLSSFQPAQVLKSGRARLSSKSALRNILVVTQFAIAISMIGATFIATRQLDFMRNRNIGFDKNQVVLLGMSRAANEKYQTIKNEFTRLPGVLDITASMQRLGNNIHQMGLRAESADTIRSMSPSNTVVDFNFSSFYDLELIAGRELSESFATDRHGQSFIINEAFVRDMGWDEAIGKGMKLSWKDTLGAVVGVVKDFNYNSLHKKIEPLVMSYQPDFSFSEISVRIASSDIPGTIAQLKNSWERLVPDRPFHYEFLDQHFAELYRSDQQVSQIVGIVTVLSIVIACMGLFGLASVTTEQRTKEIGIRKAMGATIGGLLVLLTRGFARLVLIAFVIAAPLTYVLANRWLQDFAYRIEVNFGTFIVAGVVAIMVALLTVSYHAIRVARSNPVEALRYE